MSNKVIWLTDRTRIVTDWQCPRKRYLNYHAEGRGLVSADLKLELFLGIIIHDSLAAIAFQHQSGSVDIDLIASTAGQQVKEALENRGPEFCNEQSTLVEGLIRGFYRHVWPRLMAQYPKIIAIEQEMSYDINKDIRFMSRPDLILESPDGEWAYIEYKSTGSKREEWVAQWTTAVQVHSTIKAVEATLGQAPSTVIVQGLYKGFSNYGKLNSPIVYGYLRQGQPPFSKDEFSYEYKKGFFRAPIWTLPGGVKQWIENMPPEVLADQFPQTPPIFVKDALVEAFFRQRIVRETEIRMALDMKEQMKSPADQQAILDGSFPQNWGACNTGYGTGCEYRPVCHGRLENPLSSGYELREPHHDAEMESLDNAQS